MKSLLLTLSLILSATLSFSQYYLRGELKDEQGKGIGNAGIRLASKGNFLFNTGATGAFGIPTGLKVDTITFTAPGYDTLKTAVVSTQVGSFVMKAARKKANTSIRLSSYTKNLKQDFSVEPIEEGETYTSTVENGVVNTDAYPETGFALHVDRASYSNVRRFLNNKEKPPVDAVRIEEMLNYFNFKTKDLNDQKKTFTLSTNLTSCPWNKDSRLLFINVQARKIDLDKTPRANLVFLIDVSGSMDMPNRLPLLKSAFKLLTENLREKDIVSIVTYGDVVTELLPPTNGSQKQKIIETIEGLRPNGATPGASAIRTAYAMAAKSFIPGGNNRVILATDGDFNVGQATEKELEEMITRESKSGVYLTCLGVGMGNYKDSKLEALAKAGNGNFAYLDNEQEAEKVLVEEFAQTMYTVANNVSLNLKFNPAAVKDYRLIGFDNKKSAIADQNNDITGGEIGSGHSILATFEITPAGTANISPLASLLLSYQLPGKSEVLKEQFEAKDNYQPIEQAETCLRFASSVIMFGSLLKQSEFSKDFSWDELYDLAIATTGQGNLLQKEFVDLIAKAKKMYPARRKRSVAKAS